MTYCWSCNFAAFLGLPTTWAPATIISPTEEPTTEPQIQRCVHHWLWPPPLLVMIPRLWNQMCCWGHQQPFQWWKTPCNTCQTPHSYQSCECQQPEPNGSHALPDSVPLTYASAFGTLHYIPMCCYPEGKGFLYWNQEIVSGRGDCFSKCAYIYKRIRHQEEPGKQIPTKRIQ